MPSRDLVRPFFPSPPPEYSTSYMNALVRAFSIFMGQHQNPGEGRNTRLVLTAIQEGEHGLETGELFHIGGIVYVTLADQAHVTGASLVIGGGTVTVSIT